MMLKIYKFICIALLSVGGILHANASISPEKTDSVNKSSGKLYTSREAARQALIAGETPAVFGGISVGVDLVGPVMTCASSYGHYEAMCRLTLLETYFPVVEIGVGECDKSDESTNVNFSTRAPYFRIGCDMNFAKNKLSGNRIFGGVRYGFSSFDYEIVSPDLVDPNWGTVLPFQHRAISGKKHWGELLFGIESRICRFMQIGWAVRYKFSLADKHGESMKPWYVPGFGRNKDGLFGANFNLIFEL